MNRILNIVSRQRRAALTGRRADSAGPLLYYVVLGAFVLGVVPASPDGLLLAQARRADASVSAGVRKSAKVDAAPFRGFITRAKRLKDQGKLDLSKRQTITIEADRRQDGTLANAVVTGESASNPHFRAVAQDFVSAVSDSHALRFLEDVSRVRMTFTLEGESFTARTAAEAPSEARAEEMARGYRMMLNFARMMRRGGEEAAVLNNMKISSSGKHLVMNLDTTREAMGNLLLRQITPN